MEFRGGGWQGMRHATYHQGESFFFPKKYSHQSALQGFSHGKWSNPLTIEKVPIGRGGVTQPIAKAIFFLKKYFNSQLYKGL